ncbi:MAG: response regulator [Acidobacteria bacterium]|nr:response regulator [Acidobacteriota bacterium]
MTKKILIVEDSPMELKRMETLLSGQGYSLLSVTDGDAAVAAAREYRPDLILLDVVLPKKNGYQVCRQLKSAPETANLKIVMVSSKSQEMDKYWGMKQGADGYLTKPIDPAAVLAAVANAVDGGAV